MQDGEVAASAMAFLLVAAEMRCLLSSLCRAVWPCLVRRWPEDLEVAVLEGMFNFVFVRCFFFCLLVIIIKLIVENLYMVAERH